jgi:hypothetical protein
MAASPSNTHAAAALRKRLAEVSGELLAIEKRWRGLREAHAALSQTLRMFDPEADSHPVKPKRPYRRVLPRGGAKLRRLVIDALRVSGRPMTLPDVMAALGNHVSAIPDAERRVRAALNYLARSRGNIAKENALGAARWSLPLDRLGTAIGGRR